MIKKIVSITLLISIIILLNSKIIFPLPLGKLLSPFTGYAALVQSDKLPTGFMITPHLIDTVNIKWDELRIPHIEAKNEQDLYFMQGYVSALERLWQMEFQTHAASGRLSEIIGDSGLDYDRFQRRIGMVYGANNTLNEIKKNDSLYIIIESFTKGVNFYINSLGENQYPIEYKILDYKPEPWTPLKTSLLLKSMAWSLTARVSDLEYSKILNDFGLDVIEDLFPIFPFNHTPIIPKNINFNDSINIRNAPKDIYKTKYNNTKTFDFDKSSLGSNNWVLSGRRTKNKKPILSNDPHLKLSLPSIWYLMHLKCPTINTMGVTIPGAPGIIIGFNEDISWGVTNGYDDTMDWYEVTFYDNKQNEYFYDNQWISTEKIIEKIQIKGEDTFYDTVTYTHHGPVVWDGTYKQNDFSEYPGKYNLGLALRWTAHDKSNELLSFYLLNKASNYNEFKETLKTYVAPGQNFIYSDIHGDIAIFHSGKSPLKWRRHGMFIVDGSDPLYEWNNYIPFKHRPHTVNPNIGYLSSANQNPVDEQYPYYLSEYFAPPYRGNQINIRLDTLYSATINDMENIQLDNTYLFAKYTLPKLLSLIDLEKVSEDKKYWINILEQWDYKYDRISIAPTFFDYWISEIEKSTWGINLSNDTTQYIWPNINKLEELIITNPKSKWFDDKNTTPIEELYDVCNKTFDKTIEKFSTTLKTDSTKLQWGNYRGTDIMHLANMDAFSSLNLKTSGAKNIINATRKYEGPSWRYIIEMGNPKKIKAIYPGGQSGYPGSTYYDNFIDDWVNGNYYDLLFPNNNNEIKGIELRCFPQH